MNNQAEIESIILYPDRFRQELNAPGFSNLSLTYEFDNKHLIMLSVDNNNIDILKMIADSWGKGSVIIITHAPTTTNDIYAVKDLLVKSLYINGKIVDIKRSITFIEYLRYYGKKNNIVKIDDI